VDAAQQLVHDLDLLAVAGVRSDHRSGRGHRVDDRPGHGQVLGGAGHHHQQVALRGPAHPSRDRCVDEAHAEFAEAPSPALDRAWTDGRHHDDDRSGLELGGRATLAEEDGLDLVRGRHHQDEYVGTLGGRPDRVDRGQARAGQ
jgi:hypothetical protein